MYNSWCRTEAGGKIPRDQKTSALCPTAELRQPTPHRPSITRAWTLRHQAHTGRAHCVSRTPSSAVLTHGPCGQDLSIACRFDRGSTPRTWLERRDRASDAREQQRTQGDQRCPADNRSSRQRSEAGVRSAASKAFGGGVPRIRAARSPTGRTLLAPVTAVSAPVTRSVTFSSCGDLYIANTS